MVLVARPLVWVVLAVAMGIMTSHNDATVCRESAERWQSIGSPCQVLSAAWDPDLFHQYPYPPTSWPFVAIVDAYLIVLVPVPGRHRRRMLAAFHALGHLALSRRIIGGPDPGSPPGS